MAVIISGMMNSSSRRVRCKAFETLRSVAEEDKDNRVVLGLVAGFLFTCSASFSSCLFLDDIFYAWSYGCRGNHSYNCEAVSLLYVLSKTNSVCEKIDDSMEQKFILGGMASSKSEKLLTVGSWKNTRESEKVWKEYEANGWKW